MKPVLRFARYIPATTDSLTDLPLYNRLSSPRLVGMTAEVDTAPDAVDLINLIERRASVPANTTVETVQAEFARNRWSFLAVLDGEKLLGVCARRELIQQLGSRFGFALNARHPVSAHLMAAPLRVVRGTPITSLFKAASARTDEEFYDDILLIDEHGAYLGLIPMRTLARLQTDFLLGNIAGLELSRQEIAEKNRQMEDDLRMAREVQLAMQPRHHAKLAYRELTLRIDHRFLPAGGISGDFFDVLRLKDDAVGVLVCDVMGHGVRSALVTAMVRAMLEPLRPLACDPGELLTRLNRDLTRILREAGSVIFVTAAYGVFDLAGRRLRYAQAGHPTPFRASTEHGHVRALACSSEAEGPALGLMDDFAFSSIEESIAPGDRFLFFTDGVFEAASPFADEFGLPRLADALGRRQTAPLDSVLWQLIADVQEHCEHAPFTDDVCMVAVELQSAREEKS